jgi:hypothetical protein
MTRIGDTRAVASTTVLRPDRAVYGAIRTENLPGAADPAQVVGSLGERVYGEVDAVILESQGCLRL